MSTLLPGDLFIFASRTPPQGLVLRDAMAPRLPIVSTSVTGTNAILTHNGGCLIAAEEKADFTSKTARLLTDPGQRLPPGSETTTGATSSSAPNRQSACRISTRRSLKVSTGSRKHVSLKQPPQKWIFVKLSQHRSNAVRPDPGEG